jgi:FO synthase
MPPAAMERLIRAIGREPWQRTTLYHPAPEDRIAASFAAPPLSAPIETPLARRHADERATRAVPSLSGVGRGGE